VGAFLPKRNYKEKGFAALNTIMNFEVKTSQRVAIVAAGIVSPLGFGLTETLQSLRQARDCVTPVTAFSVEKTRCKTAAQIDDGRLLDKANRSRQDCISRTSRTRAGVRA